MLLALLLLLSAPKAAKAPKAPPPNHFFKIKDFETKNKLGQYDWLDDRYAMIEDLQRAYEDGIPNATKCSAAVLDADTGEVNAFAFPLHAWAEQHKDEMFGKKTAYINEWNNKAIGTMSCDALVGYDGKSGIATFLVGNYNGNLKDTRNKQFIVAWPTRGEEGGEHYLFNETSSDVTQRSIAHAAGRWYVELQTKSTKTVTLVSIDPATRKRSDVWSTVGLRGAMWKISSDGSQVAVAEYQELSALLDPPARLFVIDVKSGASFDVPAPVSAYGIAFVPGAVLVGSNEAGTIQRIDLAAKAISEVAKGHKGIQRFELLPGGKTLLVFTRKGTIARYAIDPWKALPPVKIATFMDGKERYSWDWSDFSPNGKRALIPRNKLEGTVDYLDGDAPGVSLYDVRD
ncbi:MAG: hypothetical protein IT381_10055 [Deltaproteobacteria bacterium]|nr:hypothetical protein [Deltaproteobacteria bacterium]